MLYTYLLVRHKLTVKIYFNMVMICTHLQKVFIKTTVGLNFTYTVGKIESIKNIFITYSE